MCVMSVLVARVKGIRIARGECVGFIALDALFAAYYDRDPG